MHFFGVHFSGGPGGVGRGGQNRPIRGPKSTDRGSKIVQIVGFEVQIDGFGSKSTDPGGGPPKSGSEVPGVRLGYGPEILAGGSK